jgi:hypothetical protein
MKNMNLPGFTAEHSLLLAHNYFTQSQIVLIKESIFDVTPSMRPSLDYLCSTDGDFCACRGPLDCLRLGRSGQCGDRDITCYPDGRCTC